MKQLIVSGMLIVFALQAIGQNPVFEQEMTFVQHLEQTAQPQDALYVLGKLERLPLNPTQRDQVAFRQGFIQYQLRDFQLTSRYMSTVSNQSPDYATAAFFGSIAHCYDHQYLQASAFLIERQASLLPEHEGLMRLQLAGHALLQQDIHTFDSIAKGFSADHFAYASQQLELQTLRNEVIANKRKSPFVAGLLSAAVPGLGKIYAGKTGQGLTTFFVSSMLGVTAYEQYRKVGTSSAQLYVFATLFSAFYISNIYGSVYSVNVAYRQRVEDLHNEIVFQLHIPVRAIFN